MDFGRTHAGEGQVPFLLKKKSRSAEDASHVGKSQVGNKQKKPPLLLVTIEDDGESKETLSSRSSLSERYEVSISLHSFLFKRNWL